MVCSTACRLQLTVFAPMSHLATLFAMDEASLSRLSKRQRDCLRLIAELKGSKEIARELNITQNTVNSYVAEAVALLGARDRRDAARKYMSMATPESIRDEYLRVEVLPATDPSLVGGGGSQVVRSGGLRLPFRKQGSLHNDLTITSRLWWILAGAVLVALLLAATVNIFDALVRVAKSATG
jgi:DNA-binding CsgD family transcriptional regulator